MKYLIIFLVIFIVGAGGYIYKSNQADKKRLADTAQAYEDQRKQEVINQQNEEKQVAADEKIDAKAKEIQSKITINYDEAKKIAQSPAMNKETLDFYRKLFSRWSDAYKVAGSTARISLSQPVSNMQAIRRDLQLRSPKTACERALKQKLTVSYDLAIDGFLNFMQKNEAISVLAMKSSEDYISEANIIFDYCN